MEAKFDCVDDIEQLNKNLNQITGIIDTSLFSGIATMAISVDDSHVRVIEGGKKL